MSIDEMTGIQATERSEQDQPMRPGKVLFREARVHSPRHTEFNCQF
jgi:hypothetical protein